jgi:hypothetical protein
MQSCKFDYVNPSADPWTSSSYWTLLNIVNWILFFVFSHPSVAIPSILDETGRKSSFSNIPSDDGCAAVRERLKFW